MGRLSRPLNSDAVKAADDEFYAKHPELVKDGKRIPLSDNDPSQADLRKEWVELYKKHGGKEEKDAKPPAKKPSYPCEPCEKKCKPITSIKIISLEFLSDHKLLKDYFKNWDDGGTRYAKPEWTSAHQYPVSHNMDKEVEVKIELEVLPSDACPETGDLKGEGPNGLLFEQKGFVFSAGKHTLSLKSDKKLEKKVKILDFKIAWKTAGVSVAVTPASTSNKMYVTYDTPYNDTPFDNAVTEKRLEWVCNLCNGDTNGHESVKKIHDSTGTFDLSASIPLQRWEIAGGQSAQCMDLSKFYMLATEMLGLRTGEVVYLYPQPGKKTKESTSGSENERRSISGSTPAHASATTHNKLNPNEEILLVDMSKGWNNFEACYKFTHPDTTGSMKTRYYAGGASIYDTPQEVMESVCSETHWTFESSLGGWSICTTPGPSPVDVW